MPLSSEIELIDIAGWQGGLNRDADPAQLEVDETPDALNVDFGLRGDVSKRSGYSSHASDTEVGQALIGFGDVGVYVTKDGDVKGLSAGSLNDLSHNIDSPSVSREYQVGTAAMNDFVYVTRARNGVTPAKWDGSAGSATSLTATDFDETSSTFPRARALLAAHNRVFAGNTVDSTGDSNPSRLWFSDPLDPETWNPNDYFDIAPDDGTEITGLALFGDQLLIFKDHSIHTLVGTNALDFAQFPVDAEVGTTAPDTIVNLGLRLAFFDPRSGVWLFDGADFFRVSNKIENYLLDGINSDLAYKSTGWVYQNRYFLSVPWGADSVPSRTFVYDPRIEAWAEYDYGYADAVRLGVTPYAVGVRDSKGVMRLENTTKDDGSNINAYIKTAWLAPASTAFHHRLRRLNLKLSALGDFDVEVNMRRDFASGYYVQKTVNTSQGGAEYGTSKYGTATYGSGFDQIIFNLGAWGKRWKAMQLEFAEDTAGSMQINGATLRVSANVGTRGST